MKKTFVFGLIVAALGFTACSSEDDLNANNSNQKGMVLRATVEQPAESRATFSDGDVWEFAFAKDDKISVTNTAISTYYTFTNDGTEFASKDATTTASDATWYAYFPSNEIDLTNQSGTKTDVANNYALAGATASATTGKDGLNITMSPKVAILVINNQKGVIDINVKTSATDWVSGLTANADGFDVATSTSQQSLLSVEENGTFYIAVPAGVQISVKDGDDVVRSTGEKGLTAGKYYNLTIFPFGQGEAAATDIGNVRWIQLWKDGPKFAEYNVGATSETGYGEYYAWGNSSPRNTTYNQSLEGLSGTDDTATNLWGENWRMPTNSELDNKAGGLLKECTCTWTTNYKGSGIKGILCTGKGDYSSNSVFLPAAGCFSTLVTSVGKGHYWSSSPYSNNNQSYYLSFSNITKRATTDFRKNCYSIRAVLAEKK